MHQFKSFFSFAIATLFLCVSVHNVDAQDYRQSFGLKLGTYVSASFTSYTSENRSIEAIAGITRQANQTDYIFGGFYRFHTRISSDIPTLNWFSGLGVFLLYENEAGGNKVNVAPGAILGMEYSLEDTPVNFFIDAAPHYDITTNAGSRFDIHANLGVRYIFNKTE